MEHLEQFRREFPEKFVAPDVAFARIHRGDRIFIGTGCGQPQYLVDAMVEFVKTNPKAFFDAEVVHVWTLGLTPYLRE